MTAMPYRRKWSWGLEGSHGCCYRLYSLRRQSANGYCTVDNSLKDLHWTGEKLTLSADALRPHSTGLRGKSHAQHKQGSNSAPHLPRTHPPPTCRLSSGQHAPWPLESTSLLFKGSLRMEQNFYEGENLKTNNELSLCSSVAWPHWWHVAMVTLTLFARELLCSE